MAIAVSTSAPAASMKEFLEDRKDAKWRRREAPGAALRIQKVFRGWSHRRKTFLLLERFRFHRRDLAAIHIQTMVRCCLASYHAGIYLDRRAHAAALINRVERGRSARYHLRRRVAAENIQRVVRGFLGRCIAGAQSIRRSMDDEIMDKIWAGAL